MDVGLRLHRGNLRSVLDRDARGDEPRTVPRHRPSIPGPGGWRIDQSWTGLTPGAAYQFRICYDQTCRFESARRSAARPRPRVVPGGVDNTAPTTSIAESRRRSRTPRRRPSPSPPTSSDRRTSASSTADRRALQRADLPGLAAGSHTLLVYATTSPATTTPSPASYTWIVDLTKPNTRITLGPQGFDDQPDRQVQVRPPRRRARSSSASSTRRRGPRARRPRPTGSLKGPPHLQGEGGRQGGQRGRHARLQELAHHLDPARGRPSGPA